MIATPKDKVLIVDDDQFILISLTKILEEDYSVTATTNAPEALDVIENEGPFSTIISDMNMPQMSGVDFLNQSRIPAENSVRIMLTGCSENQTAIKAINECGVFKFIPKPFSPQEILAIVEEANTEYHKKRQEREKAQASVRTREKFLTAVNHELRTPLNPIIGLSELLLGSDLTEEDRNFVKNIAHSGRDLLKKVDGILKYAESNHKGLGNDPSNFRPRFLFEMICSKYIDMAEESGLQIEITVNEAVPKYIRADREKINIILIQLLDNAFKFSHKGKIQAKLDARKIFDNQWNLALVVKDQGIGISEDDLENIYTPFEQINSRKKGLFDGLGLGLTLVYKLVDALKGNIKVHSELNVGSTFVVEVPGCVVEEEQI